MEIFAEKLLQLRKENDMTQKELGADLHISPSVISAYETKK